MSPLPAQASDRPRAAALSRGAQIAAGAIGALAISYFLWYIAIASHYPADDAFIHMRIARNFVATGAPYFNPGEPVAATSSPLWTILLAGIFAVAGPQPGAVVLIGALSTIGLYLALAFLIGHDLGPVAAAAAAALIVACTALPVAAELMETPLALLLWSLSLISLRERAYIRAGLLAGLALCARYEFALWLGFAFAAAAGRDGKKRFAIGAAWPVLGLLLFNIGYFGSIIPNTIRAKSIIYSLSFADSALLLRLGYPLELLAPLLGLIAILGILLLRDPARWPLAATLAFGAALAALYVARRTLVFEWYTPLYLLPLLTGCSLALAAADRRRRLLAAVLLACIAAAPLAAAGREASGLIAGRHDALTAYGPGLRVQRYLQIGAQLSARYPGASLLTSEIGGLGWAFPYRIIDGAGLVTPELLRYHPMAVPAERPDGSLGAIPPQAVRDTRPDLIVSMEIFSTALRREMAAGALPGYRLEASYPVLAEPSEGSANPGIFWGSRVTEVYVRVDGP